MIAGEFERYLRRRDRGGGVRFGCSAPQAAESDGSSSMPSSASTRSRINRGAAASAEGSLPSPSNTRVSPVVDGRDRCDRVEIFGQVLAHER